jgi:hypothetical protein
MFHVKHCRRSPLGGVRLPVEILIPSHRMASPGSLGWSTTSDIPRLMPLASVGCRRCVPPSPVVRTIGIPARPHAHEEAFPAWAVGLARRDSGCSSRSGRIRRSSEHGFSSCTRCGTTLNWMHGVRSRTTRKSKYGLLWVRLLHRRHGQLRLDLGASLGCGTFGIAG